MFLQVYDVSTDGMADNFKGNIDEFKIMLTVVYLFLNVLENICMSLESLMYPLEQN